MLNKSTESRKNQRFHGFWLTPGPSQQFRRKANREGGMTAVLRRLVAGYLKGGRPDARTRKGT